MIKKILFFLAVLPMVLQAQNNLSEKFQQANKLYQKNNYSQALALYLDIDKSLNNFQIDYNIGNCYYKLNDFGHAVLYYERALKQHPKDKDVKKNLKLAKSRIQDKEIAVPSNPFAVFFSFLLSFFSINIYTLLTFLFFTFSLFFGLGYLLTDKLKKVFIKNAFFIVFIAFILFGTFTGIKIYQTENLHYAVVMAQQADVMSGPGETFSLLFPLHTGSKIRILQQNGDWSLISLKNGYSGWIKNSDFENI